MKKYSGGAGFKTLYYEFVTRDTTGKLFVMEDYETESMQIGAGATIFIEKASSFLLNALKDRYSDALELFYSFLSAHVLIGDIPVFLKTVDEREKKYIQDKIQKGKQKFEKTHKIALQLHNILREQQQIKRSRKVLKHPK